MQPAKPRFACPERCRRDGWTPRRQLRFLEVLLLTRSVTKAAGAAGLSRESAHRLRKREPRGLFALAWNRALCAGRVIVTRAEVDQGHTGIIAVTCDTERARLRPKPAARSTS